MDKLQIYPTEKKIQDVTKKNSFESARFSELLGLTSVLLKLKYVQNFVIILSAASHEMRKGVNDNDK